MPKSFDELMLELENELATGDGGPYFPCPWCGSTFHTLPCPDVRQEVKPGWRRGWWNVIATAGLTVLVACVVYVAAYCAGRAIWEAIRR